MRNSLRDSIGSAVAEFDTSIDESGVSVSDCAARAKPCMRVQKPGRFIEIFLSPEDRTIRSAVQENGGHSAEEVVVCHYRLNSDMPKLEFFVGKEIGDPRVVSADQVAQLALEQFLFTPFPKNYVHRPGD
jgi:hypothetical protein